MPLLFTLSSLSLPRFFPFLSLSLLISFLSHYLSFLPSPSSPLFRSSVCPIWTVTCLIFSRPSSPLCRALLRSPPPTVPGEVRHLHTCIHTYLKATAGTRTHKFTPEQNVFPLAGHLYVCPSICRAIHLSFHVKPSTCHHSPPLLQNLMLHDPAGV